MQPKMPTLYKSTLPPTLYKSTLPFIGILRKYLGLKYKTKNYWQIKAGVIATTTSTNIMPLAMTSWLGCIRQSTAHIHSGFQLLQPVENLFKISQKKKLHELFHPCRLLHKHTNRDSLITSRSIPENYCSRHKHMKILNTCLVLLQSFVPGDNTRKQNRRKVILWASLYAAFPRDCQLQIKQQTSVPIIAAKQTMHISFCEPRDMFVSCLF